MNPAGGLEAATARPFMGAQGFTLCYGSRYPYSEVMGSCLPYAPRPQTNYRLHRLRMFRVRSKQLSDRRGNMSHMSYWSHKRRAVLVKNLTGGVSACRLSRSLKTPADGLD